MPFEFWEDRPEGQQVFVPQRALVVRMAFAGIGQLPAGEIQQGIAAPGFAENSNAARSKDPTQLLPGPFEIQMVQDGATPNAIETRIMEWQLLGIGFDETNVNMVCGRSVSGFREIAGRKVEASYPGTHSGEHDCRHAVAATVIENVLSGHITELREGGANPGCVIEVCSIIDDEFIGIFGKTNGAFPRLGIMKLTFVKQALRRDHHVGSLREG